MASFGARLAFWSLEKKYRPVIICDEPFKFVHGREEQENLSEMLKMLSERLGIQMIIVTQDVEIEGDKIIEW